jgi:hypothetical protein
METSLDEGIGSSGSLSNNNLKNSPSSFENPKLSPIVCNNSEESPTKQDNSESDLSWYNYSMKTGRLNIGLDLDRVKIKYDTNHRDENDEETNLGDVADRCYDDVADLDVNIDDNEVNNIDDDFGNDNNNMENANSNSNQGKSKISSYLDDVEMCSKNIEPNWDDPPEENLNQSNFHNINNNK